MRLCRFLCDEVPLHLLLMTRSTLPTSFRPFLAYLKTPASTGVAVTAEVATSVLVESPTATASATIKLVTFEKSSNVSPPLIDLGPRCGRFASTIAKDHRRFEGWLNTSFWAGSRGLERRSKRPPAPDVRSVDWCRRGNWCEACWGTRRGKFGQRTGAESWTRQNGLGSVRRPYAE